MIRNPEGLRIGKEGNRLSRIHFADTNKMTMFGHKKNPSNFVEQLTEAHRDYI